MSPQVSDFLCTKDKFKFSTSFLTYSYFCSKGWNFGVEELYKGCAQVIDVTDDCTGEPHTIARDNIPMVSTTLYMNDPICVPFTSNTKIFFL